jgi:glycerol-3-phosphate dehydrogenase
MDQQDNMVLVIGAGINGVAITRELLLNRVPVCLVDRWDISYGTTAYSSRLIHGGLRYLEFGDVKLVRESLEERERLLQLSPQFVSPIHLFIPSERRVSGFFAAAKKFVGWKSSKTGPPVPRGLWLVNIGLWMYDALARHSRMPRHQVFRVNDPSAPPVNAEQYRWLCSYYDAQIEFPERFVLAMLEDARRLAQEHEVALEVLTYHEATKDGSLVTIRPCDGSGSSAKTLKPMAIINSTGAWVDQVLAQLGIDSPKLMGGTKGSHFLTRNPALRAALGGNGVYAEASDGRPVFLLAFGDYSLVGTTDLKCESSPETVTASEDELEYLRQAALEVFPQVELTRDDIEMHYCGVRPLPSSSSSSTAAITRRHIFHESRDAEIPVISVVGGKLTTCRSLAEEVVELLFDRLELKNRIDSRERYIPGGENFPTSEDLLLTEQKRIAEQTHLSVAQVASVWRLCGTRAAQVLARTTPAAEGVDDSKSLPDVDIPELFARHVIREEWSSCLEDLVERRLMLLYEPTLSIACLERLAALMVEEQVLDRNKLQSEVERCVDRLRNHFGRTLHHNA